MKKFFLSLISAFAVAPFLLAQGSLYSALGVGEPSHLPSSQASGMGYVGVAIAHPLYINRVNPATLSAISSTRIAGDLSYVGYAARGNLGSTFQAFGSFNGAGFAVPIWKAVFATGLYPYSRLDYNQRQMGRLELPETDTATFEHRYRGIGGLSVVPLAIAFAPRHHRLKGTLRIGVSLNLLFGAMERTRETFLNGADVPQIENVVEERASGRSFTLGVSYSKPRVFSQTDALALGASFTTAATLDGERRDFLRGNGVADTLQSPTSNVALPASLALGVAYFGEKHLFGIDVVAQNWSRFQYFGESGLARNSIRVGIGAEKQPDRDRRARLLDRLAYRAGAYYYQTPFRVSGVGIDEIGFTAGVGFPISGELSRLDVNVEWAMRGSEKKNLVRENVFRLRFALNAGELWFQKRKIE